MNIEVVGLGYIGLPTAALIASKGHDVHGTDINQSIIATINKGRSPIVEPDLEEMINSGINSGHLKASTNCEKADVYVITVQTPLSETNIPDMSFVKDVVETIAPFLEKGNLILLESTSPVGSTEALSNQLSFLREDLKFPRINSEEVADVNIAYCPERVMPGTTMHELVTNNRIIGGLTELCTVKAQEFYKIFVEGDCIKTNARTAELCKLSENAFRDVNIAFANELSIICEDHNINVWELISLTNKHPRVDILQPGPGVGGHCLAVDPWFIVSSNPKTSMLIKTAREINDNKTQFIYKKIIEEIERKDVEAVNISICLLGLAYKANSDDLRESPSIKLLNKLISSNLESIYVVEPNLENLPPSLNSKKIILTDAEQGIKASEIIIPLVNHNEFNDKNFTDMISGKTLIDTIGLFE